MNPAFLRDGHPENAPYRCAVAPGRQSRKQTGRDGPPGRPFGAPSGRALPRESALKRQILSHMTPPRRQPATKARRAGAARPAGFAKHLRFVLTRTKSHLTGCKSPLAACRPSLARPKSCLTFSRTHLAAPRLHLTAPKFPLAQSKSSLTAPKFHLAGPKSSLTASKWRLAGPKTSLATPE